MTPDLTLAQCHAARDRAHIAGAEWVIARKDAEAANDLAVAADLSITAAEARRRYFRELEAIDLLLGFTPSPFTEVQ